MILQMSEAVNGMLAVAVARERGRSEDDETETQTERRPRMGAVAVLGSALIHSRLYGCRACCRARDAHVRGL